MQLARGELVGDDARRLLDAVDHGHHHVEHVELVEEVDAESHAVLEQRLEDHVAGAVGGVARAAHRSLAVFAGVAAEATLVDLSVRCAVERQAHVLQVENRVDGLLREDLRGVLVDEVVATLDGVVGVPLPVVFLDVGECRRHASLRRPGVGPGGVELGDHRGARVRSGLDGRPHPGAAGADDDDVELVVVHPIDDRGGAWRVFTHCLRRPYLAGQNDGSRSAGEPAGHGSKVKITRVPSRSRRTVDAMSAPLNTRRRSRFEA
jgi:hypothetical protein